jgi:hypothetical protein
MVTILRPNLKTDPTSTKINYALKLYRSTLDDLDNIAQHSHLKTSDLIRHLINNFIDNQNKQTDNNYRGDKKLATVATREE